MNTRTTDTLCTRIAYSHYIRIAYSHYTHTAYSHYTCTTYPGISMSSNVHWGAMKLDRASHFDISEPNEPILKILMVN